jgi:hypothetical protein
LTAFLWACRVHTGSTWIGRQYMRCAD